MYNSWMVFLLCKLVLPQGAHCVSKVFNLGRNKLFERFDRGPLVRLYLGCKVPSFHSCLMIVCLLVSSYNSPSWYLKSTFKYVLEDFPCQLEHHTTHSLTLSQWT